MCIQLQLVFVLYDLLVYGIVPVKSAANVSCQADAFTVGGMCWLIS